MQEGEELRIKNGRSTLKQFYEDHMKDRNTQGVEAESVAYSVCQYYGIETGENSFGYLASWSSSKEVSELKDSLTTINETASSLITDIDRNFREVCKERGIDYGTFWRRRGENAAPQPGSGIRGMSKQLDGLLYGRG